MLTEELEAAAAAVRKHMPPGAGDFTVRTIARAALEAAEKVRVAKMEAVFGEGEVEIGPTVIDDRFFGGEGGDGSQ